MDGWISFSAANVPGIRDRARRNPWKLWFWVRRPNVFGWILLRMQRLNKKTFIPQSLVLVAWFPMISCFVSRILDEIYVSNSSWRIPKIIEYIIYSMIEELSIPIGPSPSLWPSPMDQKICVPSLHFCISCLTIQPSDCSPHHAILGTNLHPMPRERPEGRWGTWGNWRNSHKKRGFLRLDDELLRDKG